VSNDECIGVGVGGGLMEESPLHIGRYTLSTSFQYNYSDEASISELLFPNFVEFLLDEVEFKRDNLLFVRLDSKEAGSVI